MAVDRMVGARRDHGEGRHHPGGDAPVIVAVLGVAAGADEEPAGLLHDLEMRPHVAEIVFIALGALEQRVGAEVAAMQEGDVARIDAALHGLHPVAVLQPLGDEGLLGRNGGELPLRQRRLLLGRAHIGPQHRPALHQRIGLELDLLAEAGLGRLGGNVDALAGRVVFPAMVGAAQPVLLVAAEPQRDAAMGAELVDQAVVSVGVAEGEQALGQHLDPHRRALVLRQLGRHQGGQPIAAEYLAHRGAGAGLGQQVVLFFSQHSIVP